jgi:hypothetical protein
MPDRCTPGFERMKARMGSLVAYGRVPALIAEFLPLGRLVGSETARRRTLRVGARLERLSLTQSLSHVTLINPVLRGRVNLLCGGTLQRVLRLRERLGGKKIRRHMPRARNRQGFGWTRWSRAWL